MTCHDLEVISELVDKVAHLGRLNINDKCIWELDMLGRDNEVIVLGQHNLNIVNSVSEVVIVVVKGLFLNYLIRS
jgi:ABC-type polysaccharide/polyol phosphate transport system ATPase subunit